MFSAFKVIFKDGGVKGLYRGAGPTMARACVVNASEIPSYDHIKHIILSYELLPEGPLLHFVTSFLAGFITALVSSPVDVVKSRVMSMDSNMYRNSVDCVVKTI